MPAERTNQPKRRIGIAIVSLAVLLPLFAYMWSDILLWRIRDGMSKEQVRDLVGEPIERRDAAGGETWDYTRRWSRHARVNFGPNGFVASVETD